MNFNEVIKSSIGNFYIFLTLLGLFLIYWTATYPENQLDHYSAKIIEIERDKEFLQLDQNVEYERIIRDHYQKTGELKYFTKNSFEELRDNNGITEKGLELEKRKIDIRSRRKDANREFEKIKSLQIVYMLLMVVGIILSFSGMSGWLWRTQYFQDSQLRKSCGSNKSQKKIRLKELNSLKRLKTFRRRALKT